MAVDILYSQEKGRFMIAKADIPAGQTLIEEEPLVSCQFSWSRKLSYLACDYCLRPLETAQENVSRLLNRPVDLPFPEFSNIRPELHEKCDSCSVIYCSKQCKQQAWNKYHSLLCAHWETLDALDELWRSMHYPPEETTIHLPIRLLAQIKLNPSICAEIAQLCADVQVEDYIHKLLRPEFQSEDKNLASVIATFDWLKCPENVQYFNVAGLQRLFVLYGRNGQGIGTSSFSEWVKVVDEHKDVEAKKFNGLEEVIKNLYDELEEKVGCEFLNCEGAGLYIRQSSINHSCMPNAEIRFLNMNHILSVVSTRPIKCGDEVTISYLDECLLTHSRRTRHKHLQEHYLFKCTCERCMGEDDDAGCSSDSEDLSEDEMETS